MKSFTAAHKTPHVAVVGAGIAGLTAAYRLAQQGIKVTVYEATNRVGGKIRTSEECRSARHFEYGAEYVNTDDRSLIALCKELGVELVSSTPDPQNGANDYRYIFGDAVYTPADVQAWYKPLKRIIKDKLKTKGFLKSSDSISLEDFFVELRQHEEIDPRIIDICRVAMIHENGAPPQLQSTRQFLESLNIASKQFLPFGVDDEAFFVKGGTSGIIDALLKHMPKDLVDIRTDAAVTGLAQSNAKIRLEAQENNEHPVTYDHVVLATPLPKIANINNIADSGVKKKALEYMATMKHAYAVKIGLPLKGDPRIGTSMEGVSSIVTDKPFQNCWHIPANTDAPEDSPERNAMVVMLAGGIGKTTNLYRFIEQAKIDYAHMLGKNADDVFLDCEPEVTIGAGALNGCYVSPAPGQYKHLKHIGKHSCKPESPVSIVGSHVPVTVDGGGHKSGFMECAVRSAEKEAERIVERLCPKESGIRRHSRINSTSLQPHGTAIA